MAARLGYLMQQRVILYNYTFTIIGKNTSNYYYFAYSTISFYLVRLIHRHIRSQLKLMNKKNNEKPTDEAPPCSFRNM